ncbi:MAG: hypothetical protein HC841_00235 [Verrucomicrobiae bacterium]|nr:hypothetical protein [Verrucomicrobiae bacterium]
MTFEELQKRAADTEEVKALVEKAQTELDLNIPFWAKLVVFFLKFIPGIPGWIITALPIIIALIEKLPFGERKKARQELIEAARVAAKTKSAEPLKPVFKRVCVGSVCQTVKVDDNRLK